MRVTLTALVLISASSPALAREQRATPERSARAVASALTQPAVQDALAATVTRLAEIVLDTRVGPAAALADPGDDVRPSDTLGDLLRRDDPDLDRRLYQDTRRATAMAGAIAGGAAIEVAELRRTATRLREVLAPLLAQQNRDR